MIPLIRRLLRAFFFDELAFVRWARGGALTLATGGVAFADQLAAELGVPGLAKWIRIGSLVAGFLGGALTAGEKNPRLAQP